MFSVKVVEANRRNDLRKIEEKEQQLNEKVEHQIELYKDHKLRIEQLETKTKDLEIKLQAKATTVRVASATYGIDAKAFIYSRESGNRTDAINRTSGACGLGQALPCSKMGCSLQDYACQDAFFTRYMQGRYGTWDNAKAFWLRNRYW